MLIDDLTAIRDSTRLGSWWVGMRVRGCRRGAVTQWVWCVGGVSVSREVRCNPGATGCVWDNARIRRRCNRIRITSLAIEALLDNWFALITNTSRASTQTQGPPKNPHPTFTRRLNNCPRPRSTMLVACCLTTELSVPPHQMLIKTQRLGVTNAVCVSFEQRLAPTAHRRVDRMPTPIPAPKRPL